MVFKRRWWVIEIMLWLTDLDYAHIPSHDVLDVNNMHAHKIILHMIHKNQMVNRRDSLKVFSVDTSCLIVHALKSSSHYQFLTICSRISLSKDWDIIKDLIRVKNYFNSSDIHVSIWFCTMRKMPWCISQKALLLSDVWFYDVTTSIRGESIEEWKQKASGETLVLQLNIAVQDGR